MTMNRCDPVARRLTRFAAIVALCVLFPSVARAEAAITDSTSLDLTLTTKAELKLKLTETIVVPFLRGEGAMTSGNNVKLKLGAEATPVTAGCFAEATWTPIAFLQLVVGASAGSGWNIPIADGLRINEREGSHDAELTGGAFDGLVWSAKAGGAAQADLAAFWPGDWHHLVFRTYHVIWYRALTSAAADESWLYENDAGENRNGWNYYANFLLGYQPPAKLRLVGLLVEVDRYLYAEKDGELWGDDLGRWVFGVMGNYEITPRLSATLLIQARTMRTFTDETEDYAFNQDRRLAGDGSRHLEFYRVAATVSLRLR